jgi:hypothetical protein
LRLLWDADDEASEDASEGEARTLLHFLSVHACDHFVRRLNSVWRQQYEVDLTWSIVE